MNNRAKISFPARVRRPKGDGSVYSATDSVASGKNSTPDGKKHLLDRSSDDNQTIRLLKFKKSSLL